MITSKIIALVLKSDSRLKLTIVGKEKAVYRPAEQNSLTDALELFTTMGVKDRVNHYPRLDFDDYRRFMISSDLHFYFSRLLWQVGACLKQCLQEQL